MEELNITYEEMIKEERRETFINSILSAFIGAGIMVIIALIL